MATAASAVVPGLSGRAGRRQTKNPKTGRGRPAIGKDASPGRGAGVECGGPFPLTGWKLGDRITVEEHGFSPDTIAILKKMGHTVQQGGNQGVAQVIVVNQQDGWLEGGLDRRAPDGGAAGK